MIDLHLGTRRTESRDVIGVGLQNLLGPSSIDVAGDHGLTLDQPLLTGQAAVVANFNVWKSSRHGACMF